MRYTVAIILVFSAFVGSAQTKHTYQVGYGKQFLEFALPSHNFFLAYQRNYESRFFWSIRTEYAVEEKLLRRDAYTEDGIYLFEYGEVPFAYDDRIETDDSQPGFRQLRIHEHFYHKFKLHPNIGYNLFAIERTFGFNVMVGTGISYEKFKGPYNGSSLFLEVTEEGYELVAPLMLFEGYKRGFDFFMHFGFQTFFNLKDNFQIGFDATIEAFDFDGFPISHNLFLAKKF